MTPEELINIGKDIQIFHSRFQIRRFIAVRSGGGTIFGIYSQVLRELTSRQRALMDLSAQRELLKIDLAELQATDGTSHTVFQAQRRAVKTVQKQWALKRLGDQIADVRREFLEFARLATALKRQVGELTPEKRDRLDQERWVSELQIKAGSDLVAEGRISSGTLEMILALPSALREELTAFAVDKQEHGKLVAWLNAFEMPELPVDELAEEPARRLLEFVEGEGVAAPAGLIDVTPPGDSESS